MIATLENKVVGTFAIVDDLTNYGLLDLVYMSIARGKGIATTIL